MVVFRVESRPFSVSRRRCAGAGAPARAPVPWASAHLHPLPCERSGGMRLRRIAGRSVLALVLALMLAVVDGASPTLGMFADGPPPGATPRHVVLALGDSVPSGHACDCQPFPETYGSLLSTSIGAPVRVNNRAVGGLDTSGLLEQLRSSDLRSAVR